MAIKQTAGHDQLGEFAPLFAHLNDDVLFGEVWSRERRMSAHDRSLITCAGLLSMGLFPQLESHMGIAKRNGVTRNEMVELITHLSFYAGWPKAWSAFGLAKKIFGGDAGADATAEADASGARPVADHGPYPLGEPADGPNFTGHAWVHYLTEPGAECGAGNVTFEPGCVNSWHTHPHGQLLLVTAGRGWEQEEGHAARELKPGDVVFCPAGVKHWHGASRGSSLTHVAVTPAQPGEEVVTWLDFPDAEEVARLG
ncbi:carboxymuconolactone decarboxylase family protein [Bifidobacterium xylocopae]|uniref:Gamma-carboxymuconolactone decarboxylase n=1 Tax=Bifidobacterium xylocopae TaxID=2493119 RepID=A0A366KG73_9BIFI|nr:carboxymuconolactone decarboxylase family protein [Bifidobacterium xylocopae]RBP99691.1 gamma-carboxymuconolactone decarboxylase [Bifidobacterium xylocopae]